MKVSTTSVECVTPSEATAYLRKNDCNRPLNDGHVRTLTRQMAAGKWALNGESIIFAEDGTLIQGQHRCHACIRADTPFWTVVVRGIDKATFDTLDSGKRRSARDVLGALHVENSTAVAASARILWNEERGLLSSAWMGSVPNAEIKGCVNRHPGLVAATGGALTYAKLLGIGGGTLGWFSYRIHSLESDRADSFMEKLGTGAMLTQSDPVYLLRRRLIEEKAKRSPLRVRDQAALIVKTWNACFQGKPLKTLRVPSRAKGDGASAEEFPAFVGVRPLEVVTA